jgi:hypothetical protein
MTWLIVSSSESCFLLKVGCYRFFAGREWAIKAQTIESGQPIWYKNLYASST